ncbi:MAG: alkaline phosphatase family protein [Acidobacteria bacterium]|nr:alkaline phosphatase family protein [Acidobacteriota bacterium]
MNWKRILWIPICLIMLGIATILVLQFYSRRPTPVSGDQLDRAPAKPGVFRIAFGSCNKQSMPNHMWRAILNCKPDLWIWLGHSVDAKAEDMSFLKSQYDNQKQKPEYQDLLRSCRIVGTWDDNEYGMKNGNGLFKKKAESQQLFLDFIGEPEESIRRQQNGLYTSYVYGEPGRRIKVILLDLYYNADIPGPESDLLGEEQWRWLNNQLRDSKDDIVLLGSSLQLLPFEHPYNRWDDYPKSRKRVLQLLAETKPKLTVILSGDRHLGEISKSNDSGLPYPFYEITSSGLTHHVDFFYHLRAFFSPERNRYRVGELFFESNFGIIDIDQSGKFPVVSMQIRDQENQVRRQVRVSGESPESALMIASPAN